MSWFNRLYEEDKVEKPYICESCETLREQLRIANEEKKELLATIIKIVKPEIVQPTTMDSTAAKPVLTRFSRQRAILEEQARKRAEIANSSKHIAKKDSEIEKLEQELGLAEEKSESSGEPNAGEVS